MGRVSAGSRGVTRESVQQSLTQTSTHPGPHLRRVNGLGFSGNFGTKVYLIKVKLDFVGWGPGFLT